MKARDRIEWHESIPEWPPPTVGSMTWRHRDGTPAEYVGPLTELGRGIPRKRSRRPFAYRMQRAAWHLALGYVSGYPVRDILAFTIRGFWHIPLPSDPIPDAIIEEVER